MDNRVDGRHFSCSFSIRSAADGTFRAKFDVTNANGDIVDDSDEESVHMSAAEALRAAEMRARMAVATLEHARLI